MVIAPLYLLYIYIVSLPDPSLTSVVYIVLDRNLVYVNIIFSQGVIDITITYP